MWTSNNHIAFLGIISSWISPDWELYKTLLDMCEVKGSHTGENMASSFFSTIEEMSLHEKVWSDYH